MQDQAEKIDQPDYETEMLELQRESVAYSKKSFAIQKKAFFFQRCAVLMIFIGLVLEVYKSV